MLEKVGTQVHIRKFNEVIGSVWDDEVSLTVQSNVWTSGIVLPIRGAMGTYESILMEQGKLSTNDIKLFVSGSIDFTDLGSIIRVGIGSPSSHYYKPISLGVKKQEVGDINIYRKAYFRRITGTGSYLGE